MQITYSWEINGIRATNINGIDNVISEIDCTRIASDENGNEGRFSSTIQLNIDMSFSNFIPIENINKKNIDSWLDREVKESFDAIVLEILAKKARMKSVDMPFIIKIDDFKNQIPTISNPVPVIEPIISSVPVSAEGVILDENDPIFDQIEV